MYNEKMVVVVKVDGKVLREQKDKVHIPFGSEYSITVKNLHSTKAQVEVSIDGDDVLNDRCILVSPDETVELEGFLKHNKVSHKFKFIEKTSQISDYRGDKVSDGIVCVKYQFERQQATVREVIERRRIDYDYYPKIFIDPPSKPSPYDITYGSNTLGNYHDCSASNEPVASCGLNQVFSSSPIKGFADVSSMNEEGITVHGSESDQSFQNGSIGRLESVIHTIVLHLRGYDSDNVFIPAPITVKTKIRCKICGITSKSNMKFCGNCGTSLI